MANACGLGIPANARQDLRLFLSFVCSAGLLWKLPSLFKSYPSTGLSAVFNCFDNTAVNTENMIIWLLLPSFAWTTNPSGSSVPRFADSFWAHGSRDEKETTETSEIHFVWCFPKSEQTLSACQGAEWFPSHREWTPCTSRSFLRRNAKVLR